MKPLLGGGALPSASKIRIQRVEQDLLAGRASLMSPALAREWRLAAWAYYTAPADSCLRKECARDFAGAWARLLRFQTGFAELWAAWAAAGVDVTVFKGFAVAHLAYPHPALRYFNDIDVYVAPDDMHKALAALPRGWRVMPKLYREGPHSPINLRSPCNELEIDVHRSFFKSHGVTSPRHQRITRLLLAGRTTIVCGPSEIRSLAPVDLALIGLAVNRGYGMDRWAPKPHDYLDLLYLQQTHDLSGVDIVNRAAQLGLSRTWSAYARSCDPGRRLLRLVQPGKQPSFRAWTNDISSLPERRELPFPVSRLLRAPAVLRDVWIVMPTLLALIAYARSKPQLQKLLEWPELPLPNRMPNFHAARGVHRGLLLLRPLLIGIDFPERILRSIAVFRLLHPQGLATAWVYGTSRIGEAEPEEYAWAELDGHPLTIWSDDPKRQLYDARLRISLPPIQRLPEAGNCAA